MADQDEPQTTGNDDLSMGGQPTDVEELRYGKGPGDAEMSGPPEFDGHPKGLWVLFITEMWERFSYYGMRALLVLYLIASTSEELASGAPNNNPGFGWSEEAAAFLYAFYTWAVYLTPIIGGWIADKFLGTHRSMLVGGWIIAAGHIVLAMTEFFDATPGQIVTMQANPGALLSFLAGLVLIIIGTGFFKPCVSVMVGQLYGPDDPRRDSGFTIFYMGINLGAFLSPLVAGYLGEKVGWHWGFGSAAVGMIAGIITYQFMRPKYLKGVGLSPKQIAKERASGGVVESKVDDSELKRPLNMVDLQRIAVILVLAFVGNIFFWAAFEQAGSSMNVFAKNDTDRTLYGVLEGSWHDTQTDVKYGDDGKVSNEAAATLQPNEFGWIDPSTGIIYTTDGGTARMDDPQGVIVRRDNAWFDTASDKEYPDCGFEKGGDDEASEEGAELETAAEDGSGFMGFLKFYFGSEGGQQEVAAADDEEFALERVEGGWKDAEQNVTYRDNGIVSIPLEEGDAGEVEEGDTKRKLRFQRNGGSFPASFYQSVNALTIVICAPFFSMLWVWLNKRKMNPSTPMKFTIGLWLLGLAFIAMVFGSMEASNGEKAGPHWLLITYVVYTWGELCLSPVGLSMVTKLAPAKLQSLMMGVWFFSFSLANLLGGLIAAFSVKFKPEIGAYCNEIAPKIQIPGFEGLAGFYVLLVALPIAAGFVILFASPVLKKMMHGIK